MSDTEILMKATLRIPARPLRNPVLQELSEDLVAVLERRMLALEADIQRELGRDDTATKSHITLCVGGSRLQKAATSTPPAAPKSKAPPKTVMPDGSRKLTASGYVHVETPGSRGGKFWRDDKGNVRYGERPSGNYKNEAAPEHVVEYFRQYLAPQPFGSPEHRDMHEALLDSDVMSETDRGFIEFWNENYDDILGLMSNGKISRSVVEKAGGLQNITFRMHGRNVGIGEMVEEFFRSNAHLFVGDETYGEPEDEDAVIDAVRGVMARYQQALTSDPQVKAAAQALAEKHLRQRDAFYLQCEQSQSLHSKLADVFVDVGNQGMSNSTLMMTSALLELGLMKKGESGKVSQRRMRGAIVPNSTLLLTGKNDVSSIWKNDQLERLNAGQLMAVWTAAAAQHSFTRDNEYAYDPAVNTEEQKRIFDLIAKKLNINEPGDQAWLLKRLGDVTAHTLQDFTKHNKGESNLTTQAEKTKASTLLQEPEQATELAKAAFDEEQRIADILAAQEDTTFNVPKTMADGVWNGKTLKDPNDPSKGVWAPFDYQKKYINWMMAAKRGVLAADAGLGKTPMVIAFREMLAEKGTDVPAICFLPPSLMEQWPAAVAKFAPGSADKILNLSGLSLEERKVALQSDLAKNAKYIFISTGTLTGDAPDPDADESENDGTGGSDQEMVKILQGLQGAVFIDEAHQGGYKKAGNSRHEIAKAVMKGRDYAFGMTATPMPNDPMDTYHLANLFSPGSVGSEELWTGRTAGVAWNEANQKYDVSHPEHLAELNTRLKPHVFYKSINDDDVVADLKKGLPKKTGVHHDEAMHDSEGDLEISKHVVSSNGLSQHDYFKPGGVIEAMVGLRISKIVQDREAAAKRGDIDPKTGEPVEPMDEKSLALLAGGMKITLQRQASISPALIDPSYRMADGSVAHTPKIKAICDDIVAHFSNGGQGGASAKPIVSFSSFPQKAFPLIKKALAERGVDPSLVEVISGDVDPTERGYMQDKLNKGHIKVLLVGTMSGGAGLNLQEAANKTLFVDEPWSPAAKRQAIGRVWRTGQNSVVHEKTYRSMGTFDSAIEQKLAGKQVLATALLGKKLPTAEDFEPKASVSELLGRSGGYTEQQLSLIIENAKGYDSASVEQKQAERMVSLLQDKDWVETAEAGGRGGVSATLEDSDYQPNVDAQKQLKKQGAHVLAQPFDEKAFRAKWEMDRDLRRSNQDHQVANLMAEAYMHAGDDEKAALYKKRALDLEERFPHLKKVAMKKPTKAKTKAKKTASKKATP